MTLPDSEADLRRLAERRVRAREGFWIHLAIFVAVNGFLIGLNLITSPQTLWSVFPFLGWGIGLAAHGASVFASLNASHDRAVDAELQRLRRRRGPLT